MSFIEAHQFRWIQKTLIDKDIPFVVIGGMAVKFYCSERQTTDVDLFVSNDPIHIDRLIEALRNIVLDPNARAKLLCPKVGHFKLPRHQIDFLTFPPGLDFSEAYGSAEFHNEDGVHLPILSRKLLIGHKEEVIDQGVGEGKDRSDIELLRRNSSDIGHPAPIHGASRASIRSGSEWDA